MSNITVVIALLFLASSGMAGTVAVANCDRVSDSETAEATCNWVDSGGGGVESTDYAAATADYNSLTASADSMWCLGAADGDPDCEPNAEASASFSQTADFIGLSGNGTLVFSDVTGYAYQSVYYGSTVAFGGIFFQYPAPTYTATIPIVFGEPITIGGSVSAFASDSDGFGPEPRASLSVGAFTVLDASGSVVQSFSALADLDSAVYNVQTGSVTAAPEPRLAWMVGLALLLLKARMKARSKSMYCRASRSQE